MKRGIRVLVGVAGLFAFLSVAWAAQVPITVFPNPIQFGTVALNSSGYQTVFVSNISTTAVNVTGITISGANSSDFGFFGQTCVEQISGGQSCTMVVSFTPSGMSSFSASLVISFTGSGSPISIPLYGTGGNPLPTLNSISPATVYVGSPNLTLTVNGTGFLPTSIVEWDYANTPLKTTYKSSTQLTAQVPASYLSSELQNPVFVTNPAPGGGNSQSLTLSVIGQDPFLNSISPATMVAGSGATQIVLTGSNFMTGAQVLWNGRAIPTTYVNSGEVEGQLTAGQVSKPQMAQIAVSNPGIGGVSDAMTFNITYAANMRSLDLPANALVWDPYAQSIYASLPSSYGVNGNSIAVVNPKNGKITGYYFAGSEPTQMALSSDGKYLYVGLNGDGSVQRFMLPGFTPDINISLGTSEYGGVYTAGAIEVSPGDSHTIAVVPIGAGCCGGSAPLEFFTDANQLPNTVSSPGISYIQFASASTLYGYSNSVVSEVAVNANGGTLTTQWDSLLTGSGGIVYDAGLIYGENGQVLDPSTGMLVGTYDVGSSYFNNTVEVWPESAINSTFAVGITPFFNGFGVTSYNLSHFTPTAVINLSQLSGTAQSLTSWGSNGLAFVLEPTCCGTAQTEIVQSSMMNPPSTTSNPVPVASSLSPSSTVHGSGNFQLTVNGSGFVPGSSVSWNGRQLTVSYVSANQLTAYVPYSDDAAAGTASVVVTNPAPGGGKSGALTFTIN